MADETRVTESRSAKLADSSGGSGSRHGTRGPSTRVRLAWYGGIGAMAAINLIEWPVALVVAASHYIQDHSNDQLADELVGGADAGV